MKSLCSYIRDARYTGTVKLPVFILFQTVRYHNFAQFGISYTAVPSASQIAAHPVNVTTEQVTTRCVKQLKLLTRPKQTNEENSRSEIWHYFAFKTDGKGERTDHRRQDIQSG